MDGEKKCESSLLGLFERVLKKEDRIVPCIRPSTNCTTWSPLDLSTYPLLYSPWSAKLIMVLSFSSLLFAGRPICCKAHCIPFGSKLISRRSTNDTWKESICLSTDVQGEACARRGTARRLQNRVRCWETNGIDHFCYCKANNIADRSRTSQS